MSKNKKLMNKVFVSVMVVVFSFVGIYKDDIENKIKFNVENVPASENKVINDPSANGEKSELITTLINTSFDVTKFPENYMWINDGKVELTEEERDLLKERSEKDFWVEYSTLDSLGRGEEMNALVTFDGMVNRSKELLKIKYPEKNDTEIKELYEKRPDFANSIHIAGEYRDGKYSSEGQYWKGSVKNNRKVNIKNLKGNFYNKSHSLAWSLGGDMETHNLTLGTRGQNVGTNSSGGGGMGFPETSIRNAMKKNKELKVFYSVKPVYKDDELLPRGSIVRAYSINDNGKTINQYLWVFNSQNGATIDYSNGEFKEER